MKLYIKRSSGFYSGDDICIGTEDGNKKEPAVIKQAFKSLMPKFAVYVDGEKIMTLTKKLYIFSEYIVGESDRWTIQCGVMIHNYELLKHSTW